MILGLTERVFVRRAWLAMLGLPCSAIVAGAVGFVMVATVLQRALGDDAVVDPKRIREACLLTVAVPVGLYLGGCWLAERWRKRYAPSCPSCGFEFATLAQQVTKTRCCCHCGLNLDTTEAQQATGLGLTRAELSRRVKLRNDQFSKALGNAFIPPSLAGIWVMASAVLPTGPWSLTASRFPWIVSGAMVWFALAVWFAGWKLKHLSRTLGLACPGCATPLSPVVMQQVAATGNCPKCNRAVLGN